MKVDSLIATATKEALKMRPPKKRTTYLADAQLLLNLSRAIDFDSRLPDDWRASVVTRITHIARELINAPIQKAG